MVRAKLNTIMSILLLTFIISLSGCSAQVEKAPVKNVDAFIIVDDIDAARADIESSGGRVVHIFPEDKVMIGELPKKFKSKHVDGIFYEGSKAKPSKGLVFYNAWTKNLEYKKLSYAQKMARVGSNVPDNPGDDTVDFVEDPLFEGEFYSYSGKYANLEKSMPSGTIDPEDTSMYMAGDVSVSVVLPESDITSPNTEDWTQGEIDNVHSEIIAGLEWWVDLNPDADLTFIYNFELPVSIPYEPIKMNSTDYWVIDTMAALGYSSGPLVLDDIYDYVNDKRNEDSGTDWTFVIFVVDSSEDGDGRFEDGKFAFTRLQGSGGGPYVIMTYDNNGYGISNMDSVIAHESGHIFGAKDQYDGCICTETAGYLDYENQNCDQAGCAISESSIMKDPINAFSAELIDYYAKGQLGWKDDNFNNILDIFEGQSILSLDEYLNDPEQIDLLDYTGNSLIDVMVSPNPFYNDALIDKVEEIKYMYTYEGGSSDWFDSSVSAGVFGGSSLLTDYDFTANFPEWGTYLVEAQATNRFGEIYSDTDTVGYYGCEGGNLDPKIYGNVSNYDGTYNFAEDTCSTNDGRFPVVVQYSCEGYNIVSTESPCFYGCRDGKCMKKFIPRKYFMMEAINCEEGRDGRFCDGMLYGG
jgi:hypothetical protein